MYRILIADDEYIERTVLSKFLSRELGGQCKLFLAENGREALRIYEEEKIQIAILDIEMPGINGIEAAEAIRRQDRDCCLIFLTAFDEFNYARKAISVRALDYLLKPYDEQELLLVLDEAMRQCDELAARSAEPGISGGQRLSDTAVRRGGRTEREHQPEILNLEQTLRRLIEERYMEDISVQDIAEELNYSEAYFCKLFKQIFQQSFVSYLTEYRVREAQRRLANISVNIKEVGRAVGYHDSNYFAKVFKRVLGKSPSEYRSMLMEGAPEV